MATRILGVIPTFGHLDYALRATQSFLDHTPDSEVILVDDGSPEWGTYPNWGQWPTERLHKHHFPKNGRSLTRSWNHGLQHAIVCESQYAVVTNSDVIFTPGWWEYIEQALQSGWDLVGPLTNAPGHCPHQQVGLHSQGYRPSDQDEELARVSQSLLDNADKPVKPVLWVNGFCMIALTTTWQAGMHSSGQVFNPGRPMMCNEDELQGRWRSRGLKIGIVTGSYVFHYRGVSRGGSTRGKSGRGWFRGNPAVK